MANTEEMDLSTVRTQKDECNNMWYCLKDLYAVIGSKNTEIKPDRIRKFTVYYDGGKKGKQRINFVDADTLAIMMGNQNKQKTSESDGDKDNITTFKDDFGQMMATVDDDGEVWFCAWDVCGILGYENRYKTTMRYVDKGDMRKIPTYIPQGRQSLTYVNESGLNNLIMASRVSYKGKFRKWITGTVIPSLSVPMSIINNPDIIIQLATALKKERWRRIETEKGKNRQRMAWEKRIEKECDYLDLIKSSTDSMVITRIAADYAMTAKSLNKILEKLGVQWKVQGQWILTMRYANNGYTTSRTIRIPADDGKERVKTVTEWTQKGRMFIYDLLKRNGILPERERNKSRALYSNE